MSNYEVEELGEDLAEELARVVFGHLMDELTETGTGT